jgi:acyl-CoA oxidase
VLPNIIAGDIGPKYGFNTKDNGFVRFNNVRIPRVNMLMRYTKVSKTGVFKKPRNEKIAYATMM